MMLKLTKRGLFALAIFVIIWSVIKPHDLFTWFLETIPALIGLPILWRLDEKKGVSTLLYIVVCLHSILLAYGGHYTYALTPFGSWMQNVFDFDRNHYDRLGHLVQGITPALVAYEIFVRNKVVNSKGWLSFICISIALAFSAFYELIEWWTALLSGEAGDAFLGTQGDIWDTQADMFMALIGAIIAMILTRITTISASK